LLLQTCRPAQREIPLRLFCSDPTPRTPHSAQLNCCSPATRPQVSGHDTNKNLSPRLPVSLKKALELQSKENGTSINQFVATAAAEKLSAPQTAEFFATRKARADFKAFDKLMKRRRGQLPLEGDEISSRSK
jgi:hypothetical protein